MAFLQTNFFSESLCFNTDINVFIPTPNSDEILNAKERGYFKDGFKYQVLYLLHGAYGDYTDWMRLTSIEKYAQNHMLAVVMPSASNSFYQDMLFGSAYLTYLTEELPKVVCKLFPVSRKRENTFTAGLSMGGYGAFKLALHKPEQYAAAASLSGAIDMILTKELFDKGELGGPFDYEAIFKDGDVKEADLCFLYEKQKEKGCELPKLFASCGTEDFVYGVNQSGKKRFEELGADFHYEEHEGMHDWDYWDRHIQDVLNWLPLKNDSFKED